MGKVTVQQLMLYYLSDCVVLFEMVVYFDFIISARSTFCDIILGQVSGCIDHRKSEAVQRKAQQDGPSKTIT